MNTRQSASAENGDGVSTAEEAHGMTPMTFRERIIAAVYDPVNFPNPEAIALAAARTALEVAKEIARRSVLAESVVLDLDDLLASLVGEQLIEKAEDGAALLPVDPSASPATTEALPNGVVMPPPCDLDYQVSKIDGPDYNQSHFAGGVEAIERNGPLLIFKFGGGGQVCVNGGVTYQAPETH